MSKAAPPYDANGARECGNPACAKDIRAVQPVYGIEGDDRRFCTKECRAVITGKPVESTPAAVKPAPKGKAKKAAAPTPIDTGKAKKEPAAAPAEGGGGRGRKAAPVAGTIHILPHTRTFSGVRAQVYAQITEGMTVESFINACTKAQLDGKGNLRVFKEVFKIVEIR